MPPTIVYEKARIDSVLDWSVHTGFTNREITVTNKVAARVIGDSILGQLAYSNTAAPTWKILESTDNLSAAGARLAVLIPGSQLAAAVALDATFKTLAVVRGLVRVNKNGLVLNASVNAANVYALLDTQGMQVVEETGALYTPSFTY